MAKSIRCSVVAITLSRLFVKVLVGIAVVVVSANSSQAQQSSPYVGGAFTLSDWGAQSTSAGTPSTSFDTTTTEGSLRTVALEAGWFINPNWSVGGEYS